MKAKTLIVTDDGQYQPRPVGTVIDHPEAWKLVSLGVAECVDDECRKAVNPQEPENGSQKQRSRVEAASRKTEIAGDDPASDSDASDVR